MRCWMTGLLLIALLAPTRVRAQEGPGVNIASPASGAVLTGLVELTGSSAADSFFVAEISFAYASDLSNWFFIASSDQPVTAGLLTTWDTNTVTDGDYVLRLRVTTQNFAVLEIFVTGLQIRNQTPAATAIVAPTTTPEIFSTAISAPTRTALPTAHILPSPTPLAPNSAIVTQPEIMTSLKRGLLIALVSFLAIGALILLRRN